MNQSKSKMGLGILLGVIITAVLGLGYWYFFYDKETKDEKNDVSEKCDDQSNILTYKKGYALVSKAIESIKANRNIIAGLQTGSTKDLADWQKILIAVDSAQDDPGYGYLACDDNIDYCIPKAVIDAQVKTIFGNDVTVKHDNYDQFKTNKIGIFNDSVVTYDKSKQLYKTPIIAVGGVVFSGYELNPYRLEIKDNGEYILSAYLTYAVPGDDMEEYGEGTYFYSYYTSLDKKTLLYENGDDNLTSEAKMDKLLKSSNIGKATKFEFTLKENSNGTLYWTQTKRTN